jgi:hypothetical protein
VKWAYQYILFAIFAFWIWENWTFEVCLNVCFIVWLSAGWTLFLVYFEDILDWMVIFSLERGKIVIFLDNSYFWISWEKISIYFVKFRLNLWKSKYVRFKKTGDKLSHNNMLLMRVWNEKFMVGDRIEIQCITAVFSQFWEWVINYCALSCCRPKYNNNSTLFLILCFSPMSWKIRKI